MGTWAGVKVNKAVHLFSHCQATSLPPSVLCLTVCSKGEALRSEVMQLFVRKDASVGRHQAVSGPKQRYNLLQKRCVFTRADSSCTCEVDMKANYKA